jgi:hypothetical protein
MLLFPLGLCCLHTEFFCIVKYHSFLIVNTVKIIYLSLPLKEYRKFIFFSTGVWTQGFTIAGQTVYQPIWVTPSALFALLLLEIESYFLTNVAWIAILLFMLPFVARETGVYHSQLLVQMGSCKLLSGLA